MKSRVFFIFSFAANLALAVVFVVLWRNVPKTVAPDAPVPIVAAPVPQSIAPTPVPPPVASNAPVVVVSSPFHWRAIETDDYRQYVANLRTVGCPEETIRDIIVAEIEQLYATKAPAAPATPPPWFNADRRHAEDLSRTAKAAALRTEKRALIKELIGYEWDNHASELWHEDSNLALLLGFLPDLKAQQLTAIVEKYDKLADDVKTGAKNILIEEDRAQLGKLYEGMVAETTQLLTPAEWEETVLRMQAILILYGSDSLHWDGVQISGQELREVVRLSRAYKDTLKKGFLDITSVPDAHEEAIRREAFEKEVKRLLGPQRYASYLRAQDETFRDLSEFSKEHNLSETAAIKIYDGLRAAEVQINRVKKDASLSPEQQEASLAALKTAIREMISSRLGAAYSDYMKGPGQWLETLEALPAPASENVP